MTGHVETYLKSQLKKQKTALLFVLIDSEVSNINSSVKLAKILFPGNITGVVPQADAILFSSLLNSENPYFISQAQALGAPNVLKYGLEPLPRAYLVIGEGTSTWFV